MAKANPQNRKDWIRALNGQVLFARCIRIFFCYDPLQSFECEKCGTLKSAQHFLSPSKGRFTKGKISSASCKDCIRLRQRIRDRLKRGASGQADGTLLTPLERSMIRSLLSYRLWDSGIMGPRVMSGEPGTLNDMRIKQWVLPPDYPIWE